MRHEKCGTEMQFYESKAKGRIETITYACGNCKDYVVVSRPATMMPRTAYNEMRYGAKVAQMIAID